MAKAILGHVGGPDPRMLSEMRRLQQRVQELEAELARLQEANDVLAAGVSHELIVTSREREPVLTYHLSLARHIGQGRRIAASLCVACGSPAAPWPA